MDELKQQKRMDLKRSLKFTLIFLLIMSGNVLDRVDSFVNFPIDPFLMYQDMAREFYNLGWVLLAYSFIPYENLKTKVFTFMFAIWAVVTILHNNFCDMQPSIISCALYSCYLLWLARIALIKTEKVGYETQRKIIERYSPYQAGISYNILMPVNTFRGLLQILFFPGRNPLYETRILVGMGKIIYVNKKTFKEISYSESYVISLLKNGGKIRACKNYSISKVKSIIGKRLILGFRDCKVLEL